MKKAVTVGLLSASLVAGGAGLKHTLDNGKENPNANAHHYQGLPIPEGGLISRTTHTYMEADMLNSGAVSTELVADNHPVLVGNVACRSNIVNFTLTPLPGLRKVNFRGHQLFHPPVANHNIESVSGICDGDRVSGDSLQSGTLARFVLSQVRN
jgi:hypothetical protein